MSQGKAADEEGINQVRASYYVGALTLVRGGQGRRGERKELNGFSPRKRGGL